MHRYLRVQCTSLISSWYPQFLRLTTVTPHPRNTTFSIPVDLPWFTGTLSQSPQQPHVTRRRSTVCNTCVLGGWYWSFGGDWGCMTSYIIQLPYPSPSDDPCWPDAGSLSAIPVYYTLCITNFPCPHEWPLLTKISWKYGKCWPLFIHIIIVICTLVTNNEYIYI